MDEFYACEAKFLNNRNIAMVKAQSLQGVTLAHPPIPSDSRRFFVGINNILNDAHAGCVSVLEKFQEIGKIEEGWKNHRKSVRDQKV